MITLTMQREIIGRILKVCNPEKIYLFGSYAYGKPTEDSDLDIVVIEDGVESYAKESVIIRKALKGVFHSIDVIVTSSMDFEFYSKEPGSVFKTVAEQGVAISFRKGKVCNKHK